MGYDGGRGLQWNLPRAPLHPAALCRLGLLLGRRSLGPLPSHLCAGWRARERPDPRTDPLRVSDFCPCPWRSRGAVGGLPAHHLNPSSGEPRAPPGGTPGTGGGPRAQRQAARPLLSSPAPPCHRPLRYSIPGFEARAGPLPGCGLRTAAGWVRGKAVAALRPGCIAALWVPRGATRRVRPVTGRPWEGSPLAWAPRAPRAGALG